MKEKFSNIYQWYRQKKLLKNSVAFVVILLLSLFYSPIWSILLPSAIYEINILNILIFNVGDRMFIINNLYFIVPYFAIVAWLNIFIFYKNIILKIVISLILAIALLTQIGMIMGFTSYWNFFIFLPQALLIALGIVLIYKTSSMRRVLQ